MTLIPSDGRKTPRGAYLLITMGLVGVAIVLAAVNLSGVPSGGGLGATTSTVPLQTVTTIRPTPNYVFAPGSSGEVIAIRHYETWSFEATRVEVDIGGWIEYDKTEEGIRAYLETNRQFANELAEEQGEQKVEITFKTPVPLSELRAWCRSQELTVYAFYLSDLKNTEQSRYFLSESLDFLDELETRSDEVSQLILGMSVTQVRAAVASERLLQVATDPMVYLADVTTNIVERELIAEGLATAEELDGYYFGVDSPIYDRDN
jgi:hypothetical protein